MKYTKSLIYQSENFRVVKVSQEREKSDNIMDPQGYSTLSTAYIAEQSSQDTLGATRWDVIGNIGGDGYARINTEKNPLMKLIVELLPNK